MVMHPYTKYNWPYLGRQKSYGPDKLRWEEAEEAEEAEEVEEAEEAEEAEEEAGEVEEEAEEKIRLKQYVSLCSKGRHNNEEKNPKLLFVHVHVYA